MTAIAFESSGAVRHPAADDLAQADKELAVLGYVHGTTEDGRPYYAYVAVKPSRFREFRLLTAEKQAMVIGEYGTVVAAGFAHEPPADVAAEMRDEYGFNGEYEAKLKQEALKQQRAFFATQEKTRIDSIIAMLKHKTQENL